MTLIEQCATEFNIPVENVKYMLKVAKGDGNHLLCKCGKFKKLTKSSQSKIGMKLHSTCGSSQCHHCYGKKRPEHSKHMSALAASGTNQKYSASLMKVGQLHNKTVNKVEFKRAFLRNKGMEVDSMSDDDILTAFTKHQSARNKGVVYRRSVICNRYAKWEENYRDMILLVNGGIVPTKEYVDSLSDEQVHKLYARTHGISTIRNFDRSVATGRTNWFISAFVTDLKYNTDGLTCVRTRSGLEAKMIKVFEDNAIPWSYESLRLLALDGSGFYVPDFIATIDGITYIIETKGNFYRQDEEHYMKNKAAAAHVYACERGWKYCMVFKTPKDLNFLKTAVFLGE